MICRVFVFLGPFLYDRFVKWLYTFTYTLLVTKHKHPVFL